MARKLLALFEVNPNPTAKDINLYDAIFMLKKSWDEVSTETIKNCFRRSGFGYEPPFDCNEEVEYHSNWNELSEKMSINIDFDEYVSVDDDIITSEKIYSLPGTSAQNFDDSEDTEIDADINEEITEEPVKLIEAMNAISTLRWFHYQSNEEIEKSLELIDKIVENVFKLKSNAKQSKITDYFSNNTLNWFIFYLNHFFLFRL